MSLAKVTLTIPEELLTSFKNQVGDRKISKTVTDLIKDFVEDRQKKQALEKADEIAEYADSVADKPSIQYLIDQNKNDRE